MAMRSRRMSMKVRQSELHLRMGTKSDHNMRTLKETPAHGYQVKLGFLIENYYDLIGYHEVVHLHLYRQLLCEAFGTFVLVLMGCNCITEYSTHFVS